MISLTTTRGRPRHPEDQLTHDALRMRLKRAGQVIRSSRCKARKAQKERQYRPRQQWDHEAHGFAKCGLVEPVLVEDGQAFEKGFAHFWSNPKKSWRSRVDLLSPFDWDRDWLNRVNGREL